MEVCFSTGLLSNTFFFSDTYWIDWRDDGGLLACVGDDRDIKIYDRREKKLSRKIENIHEGFSKQGLE